MDGLDAAWIAALRMVALVVVMGPAVFLNRRLKKDVFSVGGKELLFILASAACMAVNFICWTLSLKYTSIFGSSSIGCIQYLFTVFAAYIFLKEKPGKGAALGALLCFSGIAVIGWSDFKTEGNFTGSIFSVICAIFSAGYFVAGRYVRRTVSIGAYTVWVNTFACVIITAWAFMAGAPFKPLSVGNIALLFGLAVLCSLGGHIGINMALKFATADLVSMITLIGPAFAAALAYVFFGEAVRMEVLAGAFLIIGGIFAYILIGQRQKRKLMRENEEVAV